MIRILSAFAIAAVTLLASSTASADPVTCSRGDRVVGPNCVHVDTFNSGSFVWVYSTVYRIAGGKKNVVWDRSVGEVVSATAEKLVVHVTVQGRGGGPSEETLTFDWNGSKYE